jgi:pimeloyl-ACP methyl ester carboxylesterase
MSVGSAAAITIERIVTPVEGMHRAISRRWFRATGSIGKPVQSVHDGIATTVYTSIRLAAAAAGIGVDRFMSVQPALADRTKAVVNGVWGDQLGHYGNRLEVPMGLRNRSSEPIALEHMVDEFATSSGNLVFLVHGFADTERGWLPTDTRPGLYDTLEATGALTPIAVRYNTGRSIGDNGAQLATLIEECVSAWPVPVHSVAFVGHSMGGLVIRNACAVGKADNHSWVSKASHVITVGSPHAGTPIEKLIHGLAAGLGVAGETIPLQEFVDTRSRGIKDLRVGLAGEALPPGIAHHFVAGVFTAAAEHPMGALLGDLVVRVPSAGGGPEVEPTNTIVVAGVRHNELVNHADVVGQIINWLQ